MELTCASCGAENPAGARFCSDCGAPLQQTCPGCGAEQPANAAFCSSCGIALREGARLAADERQERRVVTVLFADLAGSTALGERLDPEDFRELLGELFDLINSEVERFGGTTEKYAGDAVLAVFGNPQAHEDDPERAVRTALAVRDRFGSFAERVEGRHGAKVGLRIGVNTGRRRGRPGRRYSRGADGQRGRGQRRGSPATTRRAGRGARRAAHAGGDCPDDRVSPARGPGREGQAGASACVGRAPPPLDFLRRLLAASRG